MLFFGSASLVSGMAIHSGHVNFALTVYNTGLWFSGACHLFAAIAALTSGGWVIRKAGLAVSFAYAVVLLVVSLLTFTALDGLTPVFFIQGEGPQTIRQIILFLAASMFALAALMVVAKARNRDWIFGQWYAMSLTLIAIGILAFMIPSEVGSLSGWTGRIAQYLGSLYMLGAVVIAGRQTGEWDTILQDALEHSEQRFRTLAEATSEGVVISEDGVIVDANRQFGQLLGYKPSELFGKPIASILPTNDGSLELHGTEGAVEHPMIRRDGQQIIIEAHGRTLYRHARKVCFLAIHDITERKKQEEIFRAANKRVVDILESISDGVVSLDRNWNYTYVNRAAASALQTTPEKLIGQNFWKRWPQARDLKAGQALPQCLAEGRPIHYEEDYAPLNSWFDCHCYPSSDGVSLFFTDITERKKAEQALREVEEVNERNLAQLDAIVNQMTEGLVIFDPEGNLLEMNPAALEIHGFSNVKTLRQHIEQLPTVFELSDLEGNILPPDQWPIGRVLKGETFSAYEVRVRRVEIEKAWIASYGGTPVYDEHGNIQLAIVTLRDITSHKKAEQALRESEQRFRTVIEKSRDGIHQFDVVHNRYVFASPSTEELTGFSRKELTNMSTKEMLQRVHPNDRARVRLYLKQVIGGSVPKEPIEYRWQRKEGEYRWFSDNRGILRDKKGDVISLIGVSRDITARKDEEQALAKSREELERRVADRTAELKKRADQLARLTSELTLTEQRERGRLAQLLHDHLQQLLVGARYSLTLFARRVPDNEKKGLDQVEQLLNESIEASRSLTVELFPPILREGGLGDGLRWLGRWAEQKLGITVHMTISEDATTDREDVRLLIFQAVRELLTNISKYAEVTEAFLELETNNEGQVRVTVADHGVGFDPARISNGSEYVIGGFGLFSIRERLNLLGGQLTIESAPDQGAKFTLVGPVPQKDETDQPGEEETPASSNNLEGESTPPIPTTPHDGRTRLLLVDDHAVMRQGLSSLLNVEKDLVIVGEAADGQEAVEMARTLQPDLILMDFSMPRLDGVQATRIIHETQPEIRIIGLSMYKEDERAEEMLKAGAVGYVTKSGKSDVLLDTIRRVAKSAPANGQAS